MAELNKPILKIDGKEFELKKVKVKEWREFFQFDNERGNLSLAEMLDKHCGIMAGLFDVEENYLLENIEIADVLKLYHEIRNYLMQAVLLKLEPDQKNAVEGENPT